MYWGLRNKDASIGSGSALCRAEWLTGDTCWVTDVQNEPEAGCGFLPWIGWMPERPRDLPRLGLSLPFLHCEGLPEVFALAATLPGKPRGNEQEVMFPNSVRYLIQSPFSIAEVGVSSGFFLQRAPPRSPF